MVKVVLVRLIKNVVWKQKKHKCDFLYIPRYVKPDLKWYERDCLMTYIDKIKYEEYPRDPEIVNFDLIYAQCRGEATSLSEQFYQTVRKSHLAEMPLDEKGSSVDLFEK